MKIYEILPGLLYQSGKMLERPEAEVKAAMLSRQVHTVYNMWHTEDTRISSSVSEYWLLPMPDGRVASPERWIQIGYSAALQMRLGRVVMTQCYGGRNRSGLVSAIAVSVYLGITGKEAAGMVMAVRPSALSNEHFLEFLGRLNLKF